MVDVLSARMQAIYTNWDQKPDSPPKKKLTTGNIRKFTLSDRREKFRAFSADDLYQFKDRELFRTKEVPWTLGVSSRQSKHLMGLACSACTPNSKDFSFDYTSKSQHVENILKTETEKSDSFITRAFSHILHVWRFTEFDFPQVHDKVLANNLLLNAVEDTTKELINRSLRESNSKDVNKDEMYTKIFTDQESRVRSILSEMKSTISDILLRITTWICYKLFPRFLTSVCIHPSQLEMIQKAAKTNLPLIFVPLHRSHLDYILLTFVMQNIGVKSPLVAAGNNLKIPVFGWLLRGLGAFFIKRRIDPVAGKKDTLYRATLQTYMTECLRAGHNIEFYIEGGRTRTGKPCMPKGGLLSVIIGAYMDGTVEDALLVPVSINYDKLVDGNFVHELLGQPKKMESFSSAVSAMVTTLSSNYGSVRIDFNQPFSLREIVKSLQTKASRMSLTDFFSSNDSESSFTAKKNGVQKEKIFRSIPSTTSLYGTDVVDESHRVLVDKIARHLIYDSSKACAIMSTNALAFLLLHKFRKGALLLDLITSFTQLRLQLLADNKDLGFSGDSKDVVEHAISLLEPHFVKREKRKIAEKCSELVDFIVPNVEVPDVIGLSYYSNTVVTHFAIEGVVATAICCSIKTHLSYYKVSMDDILKNSLELCEIFQFEFIFAKPCESLEFVINESVDKFNYMDILSAVEQTNPDMGMWSQQISRSYEDSEDDEFYQYKPSPTYIIDKTPEQQEKLELFHMIFRPLVDAYSVAAKCLHSLIEERLTETEYLKIVLSEIKTQLQNGSCCYGESCSVELIKNALKLFKKWGIIEINSENSVRTISLTDDYNEEDIEATLKRISFFKFMCGTTNN